eukprot:1924884-Rhodomonas_salina.1
MMRTGSDLQGTSGRGQVYFSIELALEEDQQKEIYFGVSVYGQVHPDAKCAKAQRSALSCLLWTRIWRIGFRGVGGAAAVAAVRCECCATDPM